MEKASNRANLRRQKAAKKPVLSKRKSTRNPKNENKILRKEVQRYKDKEKSLQAESGSNVSSKRLSIQQGIYAHGCSSGTVSRGLGLTEEAKARAEARLSGILELATSAPPDKHTNRSTSAGAKSVSPQVSPYVEESEKAPDRRASRGKRRLLQDSILKLYSCESSDSSAYPSSQHKVLRVGSDASLEENCNGIAVNNKENGKRTTEDKKDSSKTGVQKEKKLFKKRKKKFKAKRSQLQPFALGVRNILEEKAKQFTKKDFAAECLKKFVKEHKSRAKRRIVMSPSPEVSSSPHETANRQDTNSQESTKRAVRLGKKQDMEMTEYLRTPSSSEYLKTLNRESKGVREPKDRPAKRKLLSLNVSLCPDTVVVEPQAFLRRYEAKRQSGPSGDRRKRRGALCEEGEQTGKRVKLSDEAGHSDETVGHVERAMPTGEQTEYSDERAHHSSERAGQSGEKPRQLSDRTAEYPEVRVREPVVKEGHLAGRLRRITDRTENPVDRTADRSDWVEQSGERIQHLNEEPRYVCQQAGCCKKRTDIRSSDQQHELSTTSTFISPLNIRPIRALASNQAVKDSRCCFSDSSVAGTEGQLQSCQKSDASYEGKNHNASSSKSSAYQTSDPKCPGSVVVDPLHYLKRYEKQSAEQEAKEQPSVVQCRNRPVSHQCVHNPFPSEQSTNGHATGPSVSKDFLSVAAVYNTQINSSATEANVSSEEYLCRKSDCIKSSLLFRDERNSSENLRSQHSHVHPELLVKEAECCHPHVSGLARRDLIFPSASEDSTVKYSSEISVNQLAPVIHSDPLIKYSESDVYGKRDRGMVTAVPPQPFSSSISSSYGHTHCVPKASAISFLSPSKSRISPHRHSLERQFSDSTIFSSVPTEYYSSVHKSRLPRQLSAPGVCSPYCLNYQSSVADAAVMVGHSTNVPTFLTNSDEPVQESRVYASPSPIRKSASIIQMSDPVFYPCSHTSEWVHPPANKTSSYHPSFSTNDCIFPPNYGNRETWKCRCQVPVYQSCSPCASRQHSLQIPGASGISQRSTTAQSFAFEPSSVHKCRVFGSPHTNPSTCSEAIERVPSQESRSSEAKHIFGTSVEGTCGCLQHRSVHSRSDQGQQLTYSSAEPSCSSCTSHAGGTEWVTGCSSKADSQPTQPKCLAHTHTQVRRHTIAAPTCHPSTESSSACCHHKQVT